MVVESGTAVELFRRREGGKVADGNSVRGREGRGEREEEKGEEENGEGLRVIYGRIQFPLQRCGARIVPCVVLAQKKDNRRGTHLGRGACEPETVSTPGGERQRSGRTRDLIGRAG